MRKIPATMSTQHPDDAKLPPWVKQETIAGEAEVYEALFAFKELGCQEQMWDWEGKDVDPNIVRKLLMNYPEFFKENALGEDIFLTYRVPNPSVELTEKKILIEALESIPRCYDVAKNFYGHAISPPIFEVILPFTTSHLELLRVTSCYSGVVIGKEKTKVCEIEEISMKDWVGSFEPKKIEIIPLIEDEKSLLNIDKILVNYIKYAKPSYLRVFLARSDPALNYGLFPAVLLIKIALSKMLKVSQATKVPILPIIGTGCLPFRGHLMPYNLDNFLEEYAGVRTVTVQSALKYDFERNEAKQTVERLNKEISKSNAREITEEEEGKIQHIIQLFKDAYQRKIEKLSRLINFVAQYVPKRRARRLHIGLFGYSRKVGNTRLPRAIKFTAVMYSLGLPPELVGASTLSKLSEGEMEIIDDYYLHWREDLEAASQFVCWENLNYLKSEKEIIKKVTNRFKLKEVIHEIIEELQLLEEATNIKLGPRDLYHKKHANIANNLLISLAKNHEEMPRYITEAGRIRHSLG
jgi:phosphoenolpyruvate carboxylase